MITVGGVGSTYQRGRTILRYRSPPSSKAANAIRSRVIKAGRRRCSAIHAAVLTSGTHRSVNKPATI